MIQEIFPKVYSPAFKTKNPTPDSFLLYYEYNKILLIKDILTGIYRLPKFLDFDKDIYSKEATYLCKVDEEDFFIVLDMKIPEFGGFVLEGLQIFRTLDIGYQAFVGVTGSHIYRWLKSRLHCGYCGQKMRPSTTERALICTSCGSIEYPKIAPAVVVAIKNGERLLLTKNAKGDYTHYALVAGYVEIGESLEDAVRREVMEEVGLKIKNIRYYKSQPWGFSDALMLGFVVDVDGDDTIILQEEELAEARWFEREDIPILPYHISVGHEMIKAIKAGNL